MNRNKKALADFQKIDGMLGALDASVIISLLEWQDARAVPGHLAEFGVYKGRSAALLANYARPAEQFYLVDVAEYIEKDKLSEINPNFTFLKMDSAKFVAQVLGARPAKNFRLMHCDGSHTFSNVYHDLQTADALLCDRGIVILDDYHNPHYPQVAAATYHFLATEKTDLKVVLLGSNKCYLCRGGHHAEFTTFIKKELPAMMADCGCPIRLSKTDRNPQFDCISFTGRKPDMEAIYGEKLYGHYF